MDIRQQLEQIGLSAKEAEVYLSLLVLGKSTIIEIARRSAIKRTSLYDILQRLIEVKLIKMVLVNGKKVYFIDSTDRLKSFWQEKEVEAKKKISLAEQLLPTLGKLVSSEGKGLPKIQTFEGKEEIKKIFADLLTVKSKEIWAIISRQEAIELVGAKFYAEYQRNRVGARIKTYGWRRDVDLTKAVQSGMKRETDNLREVYYLPEKIVFSSNIMVYDNKVAGFSSKNENFGFIIESRELAETMLVLFKLQWLGA